MTQPIEGRTTHKGLIDDLGAILIDLKATSDDALKQLKRYARGDDPQGLTNAALDLADLQSIVARLVKTHADMVLLINNARPAKVHGEIDRLAQELASLRTLVEGVRSE